MNTELKKVMERVKAAQDQFQKLINSQDWMDELKKYAERQGEEVKKLFSEDLEKVRSFVEKERKDLEKLQKQLPGEVKRFRTLIMKQRKELEKVLKNARKVGAGKKSGTTKKSAAKPKAKSASQATTKTTTKTTSKKKAPANS